MQTLHLIKVTTIPATYKKPIRVKLFSELFQHSIIFSREYDFSDNLEQAIYWLTSNGFKISARCRVKDGMGLLVETESDNSFKPLISK